MSTTHVGVKKHVDSRKITDCILQAIGIIWYSGTIGVNKFRQFRDVWCKKRNNLEFEFHESANYKQWQIIIYLRNSTKQITRSYVLLLRIIQNLCIVYNQIILETIKTHLRTGCPNSTWYRNWTASQIYTTQNYHRLIQNCRYIEAKTESSYRRCPDKPSYSWC